MMSDQENKLRKIAKASKRSINDLAKSAGLHYAAAHGFIANGKGLTAASCEKLAAALGYRIVLVRDERGGK